MARAAVLAALAAAAAAQKLPDPMTADEICTDINALLPVGAMCSNDPSDACCQQLEDIYGWGSDVNTEGCLCMEPIFYSLGVGSSAIFDLDIYTVLQGCAAKGFALDWMGKDNSECPQFADTGVPTTCAELTAAQVPDMDWCADKGTATNENFFRCYALGNGVGYKNDGDSAVVLDLERCQAANDSVDGGCCFMEDLSSAERGEVTTAHLYECIASGAAREVTCNADDLEGVATTSEEEESPVCLDDCEEPTSCDAIAALVPSGCLNDCVDDPAAMTLMYSVYELLGCGTEEEFEALVAEIPESTDSPAAAASVLASLA